MNFKKWLPRIGLVTLSAVAVMWSSYTLFQYARDPEGYLEASLFDVPKEVTEQADAVRMLVFGDLMLERDLTRLMRKHGTNYPFEKIAGSNFQHFKDYDIISANLEGTIFPDPVLDLTVNFAFDPDIVPALLTRYRFNLLNLANNHTDDKGTEGWQRTIEELRARDIDAVGNPFNNFLTNYLEKQYGEIQIGFAGISAVSGMPLNWDEAFNRIGMLHLRNDFVVIFIHWGEEYQSVANSVQRARAHEMVDHGADLIIGTHPHVIQDKEEYRGKWIYYSLGNFVFDQYFSRKTQEGMALSVTFEHDGGIGIEEKLFDIVMGQPRWRDSGKET